MTANTYMAYDSGTPSIQFYVNSGRSVTMENTGGILHGTWNMDAAAVTSDRRLKKDIVPLQRTLRDAVKSSPLQATQMAEAGKDNALWLLRQLRPVSYTLKRGADSKHMRFGFIADELESIVPQVVRNIGNREVENQRAVVYQDLIALLAAAAQEQTRRLDEQTRRLDEMQSRYDELLAEIKGMKQEERRAQKMRRTKKMQRNRKQNVNDTFENTSVPNSTDIVVLV